MSIVTFQMKSLKSQIWSCLTPRGRQALHCVLTFGLHAPYLPFESPSIELPDSEIKMGVASSGGLPLTPGVRLSFEGDYLSRATIYCVITVYISENSQLSIETLD